MDLILNALKALGLSPKVDEDDDITFENELGQFYIELGGKGFFHLVYPSFYEVNDLKEKFAVLEICNEINGRVKTVKFFVQKNNVHATVEAFYSNEEDYRSILVNCIKAIGVGLSKFKDLLGELPDTEGKATLSEK